MPIISSGKPGPSSSIKIVTKSLLLFREIDTCSFANFTALPMKFRKPQIVSGDLFILHLFLSLSEDKLITLSEVCSNDSTISFGGSQILWS